MPRRHQQSTVMEELTSYIASFAASQSPEGLAKLIGFFHLAKPYRDAAIDFVVESSGRVVISIAVAPLDTADLSSNLENLPQDG